MNPSLNAGDLEVIVKEDPTTTSSEDSSRGLAVQKVSAKDRFKAQKELLWVKEAPTFDVKNQLQLEDLRTLRPGDRIRVVDSYITRAQYMTLGQHSGIYPGLTYIITEIVGNVIKLKEQQGLWGYTWFCKPRR